MTGTARDPAETADVVVIGGGILGAAVLHRLATRGHRSVLLERGAFNREGSGATAGNLHIQAIHARRPGQAVPVDVARFLPLQVAASSLWDTVEQELDAGVELRRRGGFMVAETDEEAEELRWKHRLEEAIGLPTELVSGDDLRLEQPLVGSSIALASWCAADGYANPLLVTPAYLRAAARAGAVAHPHTPVTSLSARDGGFEVRSGARTWRAPNVVNVSGPWIADVAALAGARLDMSPVAIQMHLSVRMPPLMEVLIQHIGEGLSVKQVTAGQILIGGGWPARELDLAGRSTPSVSSLFGNVRLAARILPFVAALRLLRVWAGPLAATPDEMPVVGELSSLPGFFVAGGTYAFTFAPLWAECLVALIEQREPPVSLDGLSPDRLEATRTVDAGGPPELAST